MLKQPQFSNVDLNETRYTKLFWGPFCNHRFDLKALTQGSSLGPHQYFLKGVLLVQDFEQVNDAKAQALFMV